eukprot:SAG22_NODE_9674_length_575_cov_4.468487_2_plen_104_part_00
MAETNTEGHGASRPGIGGSIWTERHLRQRQNKGPNKKKPSRIRYPRAGKLRSMVNKSPPRFQTNDTIRENTTRIRLATKRPAIGSVWAYRSRRLPPHFSELRE